MHSAQLQKLQDDMENLRDQKDRSIFSLRQEARTAQEEVQVLRRTMEKTAAERDHEVSALKGNLATLTSELEKWQLAANKYERELDSVQASPNSRTSRETELPNSKVPTTPQTSVIADSILSLHFKTTFFK